MGNILGVLLVFSLHFNYEQTYIQLIIVKCMIIGASDPPLKNESLLHITSYTTRIANLMLEGEDKEVRTASTSRAEAEEQLWSFTIIYLLT